MNELVPKSEMSESSPLTDDEIPGTPAEYLGRVLLCVALVAVFFAVWMVQLPGVADWSGRAQRVFPRQTVFALSLFVILTIQGCRASNRTLFISGILVALGLMWTQMFAGQFEILKLDTDMISQVSSKTHTWVRADGRVFFHARSDLASVGTALLLLRFECALFTAVLFGTWLGRGAWNAWHFVALLLFGAVTDVWINWFHIADGLNPSALTPALRLPFFPALGGIAGGPGIMDIIFVSAAFESARHFRMHMLSLVLGALAGYCSGSLLGLEPIPGWTYLSMALTAFGILAAAWPDLKLDSNSVGKLFLAVSLLILLLASLVTIQHLLNPLPDRHLEEEFRVRDLANALRSVRPSILPM
ncbi:MAG: hypothetical protein WCT04_24125 [Planctomycetota bacterium]